MNIFANLFGTVNQSINRPSSEKIIDSVKDPDFYAYTNNTSIPSQGLNVLEFLRKGFFMNKYFGSIHINDLIAKRAKNTKGYNEVTYFVKKFIHRLIRELKIRPKQIDSNKNEDDLNYIKKMNKFFTILAII